VVRVDPHKVSCAEPGGRGGAQENASKPEGLHPSQGGKFVGFGSSPGPAPRRGGGGGGGGGSGLDDVTSVLSKGFSQLSTVAGVHACLPEPPSGA